MMKKKTIPYMSFLLSASLLFLSGCEALDLLSSVGQILKPVADEKKAEGDSPEGTPSANEKETPSKAALTEKLQAVRILVPSDPNPVSVDWNMLRQPGVEVTVSSVLNPTFDKKRLIDGKLTTSWFSKVNDAPSHGKLTTIEASFTKPVGILGINLRGDRERQSGLQVKELSLLVSSAQGILLNEVVQLPDKGDDFNLVLQKPIDSATSVRLTFTKDKGKHPGLAEIEIIGR